MGERIFFFKLDGETRKVAVPFLDCVSDLIPLLTSKYTDSDISEDAKFWTIDEQHGVRFQVTSADEIYNGAVLEVVTQKEKPEQQFFTDRSTEGRERFNPYGEGRGGFDACGPGRFNEDAMGFREGEPFNGGFGGGGFGKPDTQTCATHKKKRTLQNLTEQEDGTWVCNEDSQCKTQGAVRERSGEEEVCSIHGKPRTLQNLERNWDGNWVCIDGSQCKVAAPTMRGFGSGMRGGYGRFRGGFGGGFGPSRGWRGSRRGRGFGRGGRGRGRGYGGGFRGRFGRSRGNNRRGGGRGLRCSEHGKTRTEANLRSDGCGGWVCLPNSQCK